MTRVNGPGFSAVPFPVGVLLGAPSKIAGAPNNSMKYQKYPSFKK